MLVGSFMQKLSLCCFLIIVSCHLNIHELLTVTRQDSCQEGDNLSSHKVPVGNPVLALVSPTEVNQLKIKKI